MSDMLRNPQVQQALQQRMQNWDPGQLPQTNQGMGLMGPGAANAYTNQIAQAQQLQQLPQNVQAMQGGFGLNPQYLSMLSQMSQPPQSAPIMQPTGFSMRPVGPMGRDNRPLAPVSVKGRDNRGLL